VVRGLVALMADYFSGLTPAEIIADPTNPLELLNLERALSPTRRHGLAAVRIAINAFAQAQLTAGASQLI
jgi:cysteine desulfuration protein SufE